MLFALIFVWNRISQIVTLIPIVGMLGWFVNKFDNHNVLTPNPILILFIVSVLALSWAVFTLFFYHRSSTNALLVALVDIGIVGALIAGVYFLRGITHAQCDDPSNSRIWYVHVRDVTIAGYTWGLNKPCAMLKACFAFGIINCLLFTTTAFASYLHGDSLGPVYEERVVRSHHSGHSGRHSSHHSHRHRSRSGGSYHGSHHSHRRVYV